MADQQHENLRRLFDLAYAAHPIERASLLDRECAGDAELKRRVLAMVAAAEDSGESGESGGAGFLSSPTDGRFATGAAADDATLDPLAASGATATVGPHERPGQMIGRYKLLQQIGEGGFGVVFMAEQVEPIRRRVALKIIKMGMDTKQVIARFEAERQALAMMDHPNIARVLDAGATETGRPYFAMELVPGIPITEYCDRERLSLAERVALMLPVCDGVQHAHHKGIIHRDLKPSNVLVTVQDGKPVPKIIDFGVAKAIAHRLTERTLFTEFGQFIGTPEYMSPEQADMPGLDVDARSDVYALGVLLYEILAGGPPFDGATLRSKGFDEMRRIIREEEPPRLSARAATLAATTAEVAARRSAEASELASLLRREHEWIVLRCMEKDRNRRYVTPAALAEDLGRLLNNEPVVAAPPSAGYRMQKFLRRHRREAVLAASGAVLVLVGLAGTSFGLAWALRERDAARAAEAAAQDASDWAMRTTAVLGNPLAGEATWEQHKSAWVARLDALSRDEEQQSPLLLRERALHQSWIWSRAIHRSAPDLELIRSTAMAMHEELEASVHALRDMLEPADPAWAWIVNCWTQSLVYSDADIDSKVSAYRLLIEALLASQDPTDTWAGYVMVELASLFQGSDRVEDARAQLGAYLDHRDGSPMIVANQSVDLQHERYLGLHGRLPPGDELHARFMSRYRDDAFAVYAQATGPRWLAVGTLLMWQNEYGRFAESAALVPEAIAFLRSRPEVEVGYGAGVLSLCGIVHVLAEDAERGEALLREAVAMGEHHHGNHHIHTQLARAYLGLALIALGRGEEGRTLLAENAEFVMADQTAMRRVGLPGMEIRFRRQFCHQVALVHERAGDAMQAAAWRERADSLVDYR